MAERMILVISALRTARVYSPITLRLQIDNVPANLPFSEYALRSHTQDQLMFSTDMQGTHNDFSFGDAIRIMQSGRSEVPQA